MTDDEIKKLDQAGIDLESKRADLIIKVGQTKPKTSYIELTKEYIGLVSLVIGVVTGVYAVIKLDFEYDSYVIKRERERRLTLTADLVKHVSDLNSNVDTTTIRALTLIQYNSIDAIPILMATLERDKRPGIPTSVNSTVNAILDYNAREEKVIVEMICARFRSVWHISAPDGDNLPLIEKYDGLIKSLSVSSDARTIIEETIGKVRADLRPKDQELREYLYGRLDSLLAAVKSQTTK